MSQTAPGPLQPIHYAIPGGHRRRWFSPRTTAVALLATLFVQIALSLPAWTDLRATFTDFHMKLPAVTQLFLDLADFWNHQFGWAIAWTLAVVLPVVFTLIRPPPGPAAPRESMVKSLVAAALVLLALNVVMTVTVLALVMPVFSLVQGISGSPNGGAK